MNERKKIILIIITSGLMQFIAGFNVNLTTVALPYIAKDLHMTLLMQNWLNIGILFLTAGIALPLTKVLLKKGLNTSGKICIGIITSLSLISVFSPNATILLISRLLQGGPIGVLYILGPILISLTMPREKLGLALGILSASGYVGLTLSPFISSFIIKELSWRFIFLLLIPLLIIEFVLLVKLKEEWEINKDPIDNIGSLLWFTGTLGIIYGISTIVEKQGIIIFIVGILLMIGFYFYEKRLSNPLFNINLIKNKKFMLSNTMATICSIITQSTPLIITYYLTYVLKIDVVNIGIILLILPIGQMIVAPISGKLSDKINPITVSTSAFAIFIVTMFLFTIINKLPFYLILTLLLLQSIGYALCYPSSNKYILTSVHKKDINDANGFLSNLRNTGHVTGTSITSIVFLIILGDHAVSSSNITQFIQSINIIYTLFTILSIVGLIIGIYILSNENLPIPNFKETLNSIYDYYRH